MPAIEDDSITTTNSVDAKRALFDLSKFLSSSKVTVLFPNLSVQLKSPNISEIQEVESYLSVTSYLRYLSA